MAPHLKPWQTPMTTSHPRVQLLLTGDELMSGDTVDSNSALIARELATLGLAPERRVTLGDDFAGLVRELRSQCAESDALLVNGGLGPTVDDLTAAIVAEVADRPLREHPLALEHLETWCQRRGLPLNDANRKQALLPADCELIDNPIGSAVGFMLDVDGCLVMCTPGVPGELRAMLPQILALLRDRFQRGSPRDVLRLQTFGLGESTAQQLIADHCTDWPDAVSLSFRAGAPQLEIKLIIDDPGHEDLRQSCRRQLEELFGDHIIGEGDTQLAAALIDLARAEGKTLCSAESCTGGLIASMITRIPGSSDVFPGALVTYSNAMKASLLGVSETTLDTHGAVSEATVRAMAGGALDRTGADLAVAVSGIAGPGGGSDDKPVGTVWLAWGDRQSIETLHLCWPVERTLFQTMVAAAAMDLLRRRLAGIETHARYIDQRRR